MRTHTWSLRKTTHARSSCSARTTGTPSPHPASATTNPVPERVGFVGTGIMGAPMARNARKAGFTVTATNRTLARAEPLAKDGITVVATPREVAQRSDIVVTMVVDSPDVDAVLFGRDGIAEAAHD